MINVNAYGDTFYSNPEMPKLHTNNHPNVKVTQTAASSLRVVDPAERLDVLLFHNHNSNYDRHGKITPDVPAGKILDISI